MWQKAQLRAAREKEEAEAQAKYEAKVKLEAEKKEKADAAIAKQKALAVFGVTPEVHVYGEPCKSFTFVAFCVGFSVDDGIYVMAELF